MTGPELAAAAGRALHLAALVVLVGAGLAPALRGAPAPVREDGGDALDWVSRRWRTVGATGLLLALAVVGTAQAMAFRDPFEPWLPQIGGLLVGTDWGRAFGLQVVLAGLLALPVVRARSGAVLALGLASAASLSLLGHSWAAGAGRAWVVVADAVHAGAGSLWVGGLLVLVAAARLDRRAAEQGGVSVDGAGRSFDLAGATARFSTLALVAVPAVVVTGSVATWVHGGGPAALLEPGWGRTLALKVGLFAVMGLLGLYNWRVTLPKLRRGADDVRFGAGVPAWEALAGVGVLLVTAVLVALSPPG